MIAWFGPAILLVLLAASQLPDPGSQAGATVAVLADELGMAAQRSERIEAPSTVKIASSNTAPLPRPLPRCRTVLGYGLPAPRAPTAND